MALLALTMVGCGSSQIGQHRDVVLAEIDFSEQQDHYRGFGDDSAAMYARLGDFLSDKVALGGELTPDYDDLPEEVANLDHVEFTTVLERTNQERVDNERAKATLWYFWDDDGKLIAILRESWD
ncbi:MAG: hypothetical protein L3J82_01715 [Planctomycetes bacterium]|nr:hypothetical protein [Planctomycetota bacterium]